MRGWVKEILVTFSVILALFVEQVLTEMVGPVAQIWNSLDFMSQFWIRTVVFVLLVIFGYASPALAQRIGAKVARERLQDILLGFFIGLLNGLLIVGTLWFFLDQAYYGVPPDGWRQEQVLDEQGQPVTDEEGQPVTKIVYLPDAMGLGGIKPPEEDSAAASLLPYLPPQLITETYLYVAVALSFIFVLIVFV
jgi:uncharacterized membrane protein required for colicin V production